MHDNPLVSIIIPIYNSRDYVDGCLNSIIQQSYSNIEVILVDDGSTDGSSNIIDEFAAQDPRFTVIHKHNEGTALARQDGVKIAKGRYIQHMDSDDQIYPDSLAKRVAIAEESKADMVVSPFTFTPEFAPAYPSMVLDFQELSGIDFFKKICLNHSYWATWTLLVNRSIYTDHCIESDPFILTAEDVVLTTQLAIYSKKVVVSDTPVIRYLVRNSSISNRQKLSDKLFEGFRRYPVWIINFVTRLGLYDSLRKEIAFLKIRMTFDSLARYRMNMINHDMREVLRILDSYPEFDKALTRRQLKIVKSYRIHPLYGWLRVYKYYKKGLF